MHYLRLTTRVKGPLLVGGLVSALVVFFVYTNLISPRPYYTLEYDIEPDYYYNARLINSGQSPDGVHHPGTPVYYLGALILRLTGTDLDRTGLFFDYSHLVTLLLTATALVFFVRVALRHVQPGFGLLVLASIVAWPSFLTFGEYFGADAFVIAAGLPTIALFWEELRRPSPPRSRVYLLVGAGLGLCLAIKLSFLPVAVALVIVSWANILSAHRSARGMRTLVLQSAIVPAGAVAVFLVTTAPIMGRLAEVPQHFIDHGQLEGLSVSGFFSAVIWFAQAAMPYFVMLVASVFLYVALAIDHVRTRTSTSMTAAVKTVTRSYRTGYLTGGAFVLLMLLAVVYLMAQSEVWASVPAADVGGWIPRETDPGLVLRQMWPCALGIPFLLLYCYHNARTRWPSIRLDRLCFQIAFFLVGLVIVGWALAIRIDLRESLIAQDRQSVDATTATISELTLPYTKAAIGGLDYGGSIGEPSFHLWGNYRFAGGRFDTEVLDRYPMFTLFKRFDDIEAALDRSGTGSPDRKPDIVTGESQGIDVSLIGFPTRHYEYLLKPEGSIAEPELLALLQRRFGTTTVLRRSIAGIEWVFLVTPEESVSPAQPQ